MYNVYMFLEYYLFLNCSPGIEQNIYHIVIYPLHIIIYTPKLINLRSVWHIS